MVHRLIFQDTFPLNILGADIAILTRGCHINYMDLVHWTSLCGTPGPLVQLHHMTKTYDTLNALTSCSSM